MNGIREKNRTWTDSLILLLGLFGFALFVVLYPRTYPEAVLRPPLDEKAVLENGKVFMRGLGIDVSYYEPSVNLETDSRLLEYLHRTVGTVRTNGGIADSLEIYRWSIEWTLRSPAPESSTGRAEPESRRMPRMDSPGNWLEMDLKGRPLRFQFLWGQYPENPQGRPGSALFTVDSVTASRMAAVLMNAYGGKWMEVKADSAEDRGPGRIHKWESVDKVAGLGRVLRVRAINGRIREFRTDVVYPPGYLHGSGLPVWHDRIFISLTLLIFILVVFNFVQRLRLDLVDLKGALLPTLLAALCYFILYYIQNSTRGSPWNLIFGYIITGSLIGGGMWIIYAVGESLSREIWPAKLAVTDGLRRRFFFPSMGSALMRGSALSGITLGLITGLSALGVRYVPGFLPLNNSSLFFFTNRWSGLLILAGGIVFALYISISLCLFLTTLFRKWLKKPLRAALISALIWSFIGFSFVRILPVSLRIALNGIVALLFILFFIRYELITVLIGMVATPILFFGVAGLRFGSAGMQKLGIFFLLIAAAFLGMALAARKGEPLPEEEGVFVPDYLQRIYEKERIQRELEIARNVQLSFLPRSLPNVPGVDIASLCIPAEEVGGDYYDFLTLGDGKLGIVIGDVSGKGISAAFYMTLTKGLLKSQAREGGSPAEILTGMNDLFYDNAERGTFISMIYSILDVESRTLTMARAGHNPMILYQSAKGRAEEISPPGLALGLERGDMFSRTIQEQEIVLGQEDACLFYTDGLNEAQDRRHDEFGEKRLLELIERYRSLPGREVLNRITTEIDRFTGGVRQHDDMTAVFIRMI